MGLEQGTQNTLELILAQLPAYLTQALLDMATDGAPVLPPPHANDYRIIQRPDLEGLRSRRRPSVTVSVVSEDPLRFQTRKDYARTVADFVVTASGKDEETGEANARRYGDAIKHALNRIVEDAVIAEISLILKEDASEVVPLGAADRFAMMGHNRFTINALYTRAS